MAAIVVGIAASHSPQLSTPSELWRLHAERDRQTSIGHAFNFVKIRARPARAAAWRSPAGDNSRVSRGLLAWAQQCRR